ncbi:STAS domain-containing protein [Spirillospora sp. CA-253888]
MTEQAVEGRTEPTNHRPPLRNGSGHTIEGVQAHSSLLRLDGVFEPPYLVVDGEVDISTLASFTATLADVLEHSSGDVWVDVEGLSFIDVGGLRALAAAACRLELQNRRLVLRSVAPHLARLMDLVGWSQIPGLLMLPAAIVTPSARRPDHGST